MIPASVSARAERLAFSKVRSKLRTWAGVSGRGRAAIGVLALAAFLTLLAFLVYGNNARDGGWVGDAWASRAWYALYPHQNFFSTVGHFFNLNSSMAARPANAAYRVALYGLFGADTSAWFAWQIASCICMCLAFYALLREIGLTYRDAATLSVLLAVFPASASLWLWSPVIQASFAMSLAALGFLLALRGFQAHGRRRLVLHFASLLLFVFSILLYEVCLPLFLASFLLYAVRVPLRTAATRWLVDCVVLLPIAFLVTSSTEARDQGISGSIKHAGAIAGQLPSLLFGRLLPMGSVQALAIIAVASVYAWGIFAIRQRPTTDPLHARLRFLFALTGAGIVVILLGYSIYVPGLSYYLPLGRGIGDRVNAVAGIGWVLGLYALAAMTATLMSMKLNRAALVATIGTAALTIALGLSWLAPIAYESRAYIAADKEGYRVLHVIKRAIPNPSYEGAIWAFGQPVETAVGVPVFANSWNMTAAVELTYHDRHLRSFVALPETHFECLATGVVPEGNTEYPPPAPGTLGYFGSRYGHTYFVDTERGQFATVDSQAQCVQLRQDFPISPELLPDA